MAPAKQGGGSGGPGGAVVLEEEIDKDYEPTEKEIQEYAEWLGIDKDKDADLLWIARAGLKAPLPQPWKPCQTGEGGEIFYFNFETGDSVWDHPCDEHHRKMYHKERAKKYGLPVDDDGGGKDDDGRKGRKDKKDKKEKKEKKIRVDVPKKMDAPKELAPLAALGGVPGKLSGPTPGLRSVSRESKLSLEDSVDDDEEESSSSFDHALSKPKLDMSRFGSSNKVPAASSKSTGAASSASSRNQANFGPAVDLDTIKEEDEAESRRKIDAEVERTMAKYRSEREAEEKKKHERELQDFLAREHARSEEERNRRVLDMEAENRAKLAKNRRDLTSEFDAERDKLFSELHEKHEKAIREERSRLQQDMRETKGRMQRDVEREEEDRAEVEEKLKDTEAQLASLRDEQVLRRGEMERLREASAKRAEAEAECAKLKAELDAKAAELERAREEAVGSSSGGSADSGEAEKLRKELSVLREDYLKAQELATKDAQEVKRLQEEAHRLKAMEAEVLQLREATAVGSDVQAQLAKRAAEAAETQSELSRKSAELEEVRQKRADDSEELRQVQSQYSEVNAEVARLNAEVVAAATQLRGKEEEAEGLRRVLEGASAASVELEQLREKNRGLQADLASERAARSQEAAAGSADGAAKLQLENLESQLRAKEAECQRLGQTTDEERRAAAEAKADAAAAAREVSIMKVDLDMRTTDVQRLHAKALEGSSTSRDELQGLHARIADERQLQSQARAEAASASRELSVVKSELEALQEQLKELRPALATAKEDVSQKAAELSDAKWRLESSVAECEKLRSNSSASASTAVEEQRSLQQKLEEERRSLAQAKADATSATRELSAVRLDLDARTAECQRLHAKVTEGSASAYDEIQVMQKQLSEERATAVTARAEFSAAQRELGVTKAELEARAKECERLQAKLLEATRNSDVQRNEEVQRLQTMYAEERAASSQAQARLTASTQEVSILQGELEAKNGECRRLQEQTASRNNTEQDEVRRLQGQLEQERAAASQSFVEAAGLSREASTLRAELEGRTSECARLRAEASCSAAAAPEEVRRLKGQAEALQQQAAQARLEGAAASREVAALRAELDTRSVECGRLRAEAEIPGEELRRLQAALEEERAESAACRAEAAGAASKVAMARAAEHAAVAAELDARSSECRRLRAELSGRSPPRAGTGERAAATVASEATMQELTSLRALLHDQRAEIERLRCTEVAHKADVEKYDAAEETLDPDAWRAALDPLAPTAAEEHHAGLTHRIGGAWSADDADADERAGSKGDAEGAIKDAAMALDSRRRGLRRERAALEEWRRQWRADLQRVKSGGGGGHALALLQEVRTTLDERAAALNRSIEELRVLERALSARQRSRERSHSPSHRAQTSQLKVSRADMSMGAQADEVDLIRRWQHVLTPDAHAHRTDAHAPAAAPMLSARVRSADRYSSRRTGAHTSRDHYGGGGSHDAIEQHLHWLRRFAREVGSPSVGAGRPMTARARIY